MNKYQKALDFMTQHAYDRLTHISISDREKVYPKHKKTLQNLVERATPKKPKGVSITYEGRVGNCPACNKFVREADKKPNICECGQALDWSEDDG